MEHYWEIERSQALQEDTPQIWEQQSSFLRPVVEPNDYHWMTEPSNTTFAQQNSMWRCDICNGNHPSDYCEYNYNSGWRNYQNPSWYDEPTYFTEPSHFPSYPSSSFDPYQEPEPSEEDQLIHMFKEQEARFDAQIQSNAGSIQRITDQIRQLIENQNIIPQEPVSDDTDEAFENPEIHNDTLTEEEAEQYQQPEVLVQEPEPAKSRFDFYYSDSDEDEAELFVPNTSKIEDGILYPQNEDLGDSIAQMFDEDLPEPIISTRSEDEDLKSNIYFQVENFETCISQMTDEELNAEIFKYICEEKVEQEAEQMEEQMSDLIKDPEHSGKTSLFWGVQIKDINQKLERMELPFQVKHHTRPPNFISFFSGTNGATRIKKVARAMTETKLFWPLYRWKRPFKSNAHGIVFNRTSKTTLKPP